MNNTVIDTFYFPFTFPEKKPGESEVSASEGMRQKYDFFGLSMVLDKLSSDSCFYCPKPSPREHHFA